MKKLKIITAIFLCGVAVLFLIGSCGKDADGKSDGGAPIDADNAQADSGSVSLEDEYGFPELDCGGNGNLTIFFAWEILKSKNSCGL